MSLYAATRDLHHACERHALGQLMASGHIAPQQWADWLAAFRAIHLAIDPHLPLHLGRVALLDADLAVLRGHHGVRAREPLTATAYGYRLEGEAAVLGTAYVLHGAHRRGGAVLSRTMAEVGLPTAHVVYPLPRAAEAFVQELRERADLAEAAGQAFGVLLACMDEIVSGDGGGDGRE